MAISSSLSLDKLRPRNLTPDQDMYFRELERLLREMSDQVIALTPADSLTCDTIAITVDTINITCDQVTV